MGLELRREALGDIVLPEDQRAQLMCLRWNRQHS